jgi:hypothetical protein
MGAVLGLVSAVLGIVATAEAVELVYDRRFFSTGTELRPIFDSF